jgi:RimJ/RimL family protein N-acetyltransferase
MWRDEDLDVHARMCADPEAMRYISGGATRTREQRGATVARFVRAWEKRGYGMWAAAEKEKGELVGRIGLL